MNAYELADITDHWAHKESAEYLTDAANMLRQQADRIAELEGEVASLKHINKNWSISEGWALQRVSELKDKLSFYELKDLDTPQTKPLSDEEIQELANKHLYVLNDIPYATDITEFARAIEAKVRGEK